MWSRNSFTILQIVDEDFLNFLIISGPVASTWSAESSETIVIKKFESIFKPVKSKKQMIIKLFNFFEISRLAVTRTPFTDISENLWRRNGTNWKQSRYASEQGGTALKEWQS